MRQAGYQPPPTARDQAMSITHHESAVRQNVHHADAHLDGAMRAPNTASRRYNLSHARAHAGDALRHLMALRDRLAEEPDFRTHYNRLGERVGGDEHPEEPRTPVRAEEAEQRALKRGMMLDRAERLERRLARQGGRR